MVAVEKFRFPAENTKKPHFSFDKSYKLFGDEADFVPQLQRCGLAHVYCGALYDTYKRGVLLHTMFFSPNRAAAARPFIFFYINTMLSAYES